MSAVRMIAVFSENKPGEAARITKIIADSGVNIRWVTIVGTPRFGVMKFIVDKCDEAMANLKQNGVTASYVETIAVEMKDKRGSLHTVCDCLARNNINVENTSGFVANKRAILLLEVQNTDATRSILEKEGLALLTQEEILDL